MSKVIDNIEDIDSIDSKAVLTTTQTALDLKAPLASPALTGIPTAPTATAGTNNTQVATTAFATSQDLGVNQTWQDVTASRSSGVTYTNTTGKPIMVSATGYIPLNDANFHLYCYVDGVKISEFMIVIGTIGLASHHSFSFIVPSGSTYKIDTGTVGIVRCVELR